MTTLELFSGTKSFSKVAKELGYSICTVDNDPSLEPGLLCSVLDILPTAPMLIGKDIIWASPPCQGFSVAALGKNWNKDYTPKTDTARLAIRLVLKTIQLIEVSQPKYWFIENPRGMLRKMTFMDELLKRTGGVRHTVTYCQYGDTRQKPTDIWTNCLEWTPKPPCSPGASCHIAAPRGSRTGTQGIKGARDRGVIPPDLFKEIFNSIK